MTFETQDNFLKQSAKVTWHLSETGKPLDETQKKLIYDNNELIQVVKTNYTKISLWW